MFVNFHSEQDERGRAPNDPRPGQEESASRDTSSGRPQKPRRDPKNRHLTKMWASPQWVQAADRFGDHLEVLVETATGLAFTAEPEALLESLVHSALHAFPPADLGVVFLYDEKARKLVPSAALGYDLEKLSRVRLERGQAIAGKVFATGEPLVCNTSRQVEQALKDLPVTSRSQLLAARHGEMPLSMAGLPLQTRGQTIGCLVLGSLRRAGAFPMSEVRLHSACASYMAAVLDNARLMQQVTDMRALEEAERVKRHFLSYVTHELRTPLTAMKMSIDTLLASQRPEQADGARNRLLRNIARNTDHLNRLIDDLLNMTRLESGMMRLRRELVKPRQVILESAESVMSLVEAKHQHLRIELPPRLSSLGADKARLRQILVNLLANASLNTRRRGVITVTAQEQKDSLVVSVSDSGPGIPKEEQERIFERFYRSSRARRANRAGLGLGLPIARALVQLHGGSIWVDSEPGKGSTFSISLPKVVAEDESADR
ncbi:MAG: GAF domain-containing sensor histidine kinase [Dehalococcoidia bacterium]|nr:MAG: GAF domain-containing sensor histidine kinase [Dehalococcoidia bacterium]